MIFASDLDQTLIYSEASMGTIAKEALVAVELYEGRFISYMTQRALELLAQLSKQALFIPVTTRTVAQYNRIFTINQQLCPKFAITSNGGNIFIDGLPYSPWSQIIQESVEDSSAPAVEIKQLFDEISSVDWVLKFTYSDELFYSIVMEKEKLPRDQIHDFITKLTTLGWNTSIQGRKIYLVPQAINKGAALAFIKELAGVQHVVASGDSLLDESLLLAADYAIAPSHGELFRRYTTHNHIHFTTSTGILASEEIIEKALLYLANTQKSRMLL
jgi:HAD superfamily hydrolase (TIGR01484 family)